jgi:hypothetical protein
MTRVPVRVARSAFVPPRAHAWVPRRRTVLVRHRVPLSRQLLAHELVHVQQAERRAWPLAYILQWITTGFSYTRMPFEVEARAGESEPFYLDWADTLLKAGAGR